MGEYMGHSAAVYQCGAMSQEASEMRKVALDLAHCQHTFIEEGGLLTSKDVQVEEARCTQPLNTLLEAIFSNTPMPLGDIPFVKNREILAADREMMALIQGVQSFVHRSVQESKSRIQRLKVNIEGWRINAEIRHTKPLEFRRRGRWFTNWFSCEEEEVEGVTFTLPKTMRFKASKVVPVGERLPGWWFGWCNDVKVNHCEATGQVTWKPKLCSPAFLGCGFELYLMSKNEEWHSSEIDEAVKSIEELEKGLRVAKPLLEHLKSFQADVAKTKQPFGRWSAYDAFYSWFQPLVRPIESPVRVLKEYGEAMNTVIAEDALTYLLSVTEEVDSTEAGDQAQLDAMSFDESNFSFDESNFHLRTPSLSFDESNFRPVSHLETI